MASIGIIEGSFYLSWHANRLFVWWRVPWWFQRQRRTANRILWLTMNPYGVHKTKSEQWWTPFWVSVSGISATVNDGWLSNWSLLSLSMMTLSITSAASSLYLPITTELVLKVQNSHSISDTLLLGNGVLKNVNRPFLQYNYLIFNRGIPLYIFTQIV